MAELRLMATTRGSRLRTLGCGVPAALCVMAVVAYLIWANQPLVLPPNVQSNPSPNGFETAYDAVQLLTRAPDGSPLADRSFTNPRVLREKLAPEKPGLEMIRKSLRQEWSIPLPQDFTQEYPYLAQFRDAGRKFAAESRLALAEGQAGEAEQRALDAIEFGSCVGREGPLIQNLVGLALSAIGAAQAERAVPRLSAAEARQAGERLDRVTRQFPTPVAALEKERWVALSTLKRMFRGELDPRALSSGGTSTPSRGTPPWIIYPKPWSYQSMDRGFQGYIAEAKKPYPDRQRVPEPRELLSRLLLPTIERALVAFDKNQTALRILRLELALEEYRKTVGRYPQTLPELSPRVLAVVPVDPYSNQPFIYRPKTAGYLLYSVGPDGKDSGGVPSREPLNPAVSGDVVAGQLSPPRKTPAAGK
ncbi:MAG: hypothetical protein K0Q72_2885 [Armatimonadetes bacterium]|jgi:hypothetical protein|nr:hypothetical protein [Armatimonadota bacterium]